MGIRSKLLWPIVLAFTLLVAVIHFYIVPKMLAGEREIGIGREHQLIGAMGPGVAQSLLRGDLAAMYATLDRQMEARQGVWVWLELRKPNGKRLYPLSEQSPPQGKYLVRLDQPLVWGGSRVADVSLVVDMQSEYLGQLAHARQIEGLLLFGLFLLMLVGFLMHERFVRRPLQQLEHAAVRLGAGDFNARLPKLANDEIGRLTHTFDGMRRELLSVQQGLEEAREEAVKASQAKTDFLSSMSHELRTPMNAILGFSQLLEMDVEDSESRENIAEILRAGHHLLELIDEVLDLAKIESGKVNLSLEDSLSIDLCRESLSLVRPLAKNKEVELVDQTQAAGTNMIHVDQTRFKQVLVNLLSNAIKYNNKGGKVILSCAAQPSGMLRFKVRDTGKGLNEEQQQRLFTPFDRLGAEASTTHGTGIGLVISKRLIEGMGGALGYSSQEGEGSCFWVDIKLGKTVTEKTQTEALSANIETVADATDNPSQVTVLYIEDNPANLRLVERVIENRTPYALMSAHNANLGIDLARLHKPDLILMDINLPGMDGIAAYSKLQNYQETKDIPVIAISAGAMSSDIEKVKDIGFVEYITKPIDIDHLLTAMNHHLRP